jgi:micrococcal nuclease
MLAEGPPRAVTKVLLTHRPSGVELRRRTLQASPPELFKAICFQSQGCGPEGMSLHQRAKIMMHMRGRCGRTFLFVCVLASVLVSSAIAQKSLSTAEAAKHVGEKAKVCGTVASAHFAYRSKGSPTFLNLDEPYPSQVFTLVIWIEDRAKFGSPERRYSNQYICVVGIIQSYRGVPEIVLRNPSQVEVAKAQ